MSHLNFERSALEGDAATGVPVVTDGVAAGASSRVEVLIRRYLPLAVAVLILFVVLWLLYTASVARTGGQLIYTLDDTYIHMAMAKHFAQRGIWGVTPYEFSSSSSSLLWTLLLSIFYMVAGVNDLVPLILNIIFATLILVTVHRLLLDSGAHPLYSYVILLAVIFLTSLPSLVFTVLEHPLHILITVLLVYQSARLLSENPPSLFTRAGVALMILGALSTFVRYEGLFFIALIAFLFLLRRRFRYAVAFGAVGVLPIVVFGLISMANGWSFLPNPVFLAGRLPTFSSLESIMTFLGYGVFRQLQDNEHLLMMVVIALVLLLIETQTNRSLWQRRVLLLVLFLAGTLMHLQLTAKSAWIYRHEIYLLVLGLFVIGAVVLPRNAVKFQWQSVNLLRYLAVAILALFMLLPLFERSFYLISVTPQASANIYEQHMQMARFLQSYYPEEAVAANDIGAINYLTPLHNLDLYGLATRETAYAMRENTYTTEVIDSLARQNGVIIALVYDEWIRPMGGVPAGWIKVGEWTIQNNIVAGDDTVSFYAVDESQVSRLEAALRDFAPRLPETVRQSGRYTQAS